MSQRTRRLLDDLWEYFGFLANALVFLLVGFSASLGCAYGRAGRRSEAQQLLANLQELSTRRYVGSYDLAMIYAGLDEKDQAFAQLEKAFTERSNQLVYLNGEPAWETLHSDPRFADLLRRIGLAQ